MEMIAIPNRDLNLTPNRITPNLLDQMLQEFPAALVIIDPILAYANGRNTDKASDVRSLLGPLSIVAERHKAALLLVLHMTKDAQKKALYRGQGSVDFVAIARSVFVFAQDAVNHERRLMAHAKSSIGALQPTLEYLIDSDGHFRWGDQTSCTADEALGTGELRKERESKQLDAAEQFLKELLSNGPVASNTVRSKTEQAGLAWRTVWRAKETLAVKSSKDRSTGEWFWRLS